MNGFLGNFEEWGFLEILRHEGFLEKENRGFFAIFEAHMRTGFWKKVKHSAGFLEKVKCGFFRKCEVSFGFSKESVRFDSAGFLENLRRVFHDVQ